MHMLKMLKRFFLFLSLSIGNGYLFVFINKEFFQFNIAEFQNLSPSELILFTIFVAPVIETLFFQFYLFKLLKRSRYFRNDTLCIIVMSVIFSQCHWYNWLYVMMTFVGGLILNTYYVSILQSTRHSFFLTMLLHSTYNLYGLLFVE